MINVIIVLAVLVILGGAALYIFKAKKAGDACVGCPHSGECASHSSCCSNEMKQTQHEG